MHALLSFQHNTSEVSCTVLLAETLVVVRAKPGDVSASSELHSISSAESLSCGNRVKLASWHFHAAACNIVCMGTYEKSLHAPMSAWEHDQAGLLDSARAYLICDTLLHTVCILFR